VKLVPHSNEVDQVWILFKSSMDAIGNLFIEMSKMEAKGCYKETGVPPVCIVPMEEETGPKLSSLVSLECYCVSNGRFPSTTLSIQLEDRIDTVFQ
jgi:hypothetical protein